MAHLIDMTTGKAGFVRRQGTEKAWHGLGTTLSENATTETWAKEAGLDWQVLVEKGYYQIPSNGEWPNDAPQLVPIPDVQVFRRSDTGAFLSLVGPHTYPLQNEKAFAFFQPFLDSGLAKLETAMSLDEGRRIVVTAALANGIREIVPGDEVKRYLTLAHSHDNTLTVRVGLTPQRIVCDNTLQMAIRSSKSQFVRIRHGKDVERNVERVRATIDAINAEFSATEEQYRALASRRNINQKDLKNYVKKVFKMEEKADGTLATRTQNTLDDILRLHDKRTGIVSEMLREMKEREEKERETHKVIGAMTLEAVLENMEAGKGTDIKDARNSWWTAYNAVTEYLTHSRGRSSETLVNSNLFGVNAETNKIALQTAMEMSGLSA